MFKENFFKYYTIIKTIVFSEWTHTICAIIVAATVMSYITNSRIEQQMPEIRINAVRHFIEHPSAYKLDTLYRKANDTLYIDTIKVNYR